MLIFFWYSCSSWLVTFITVYSLYTMMGFIIAFLFKCIIHWFIFHYLSVLPLPISYLPFYEHVHLLLSFHIYIIPACLHVHTCMCMHTRTHTPHIEKFNIHIVFVFLSWVISLIIMVSTTSMHFPCKWRNFVLCSWIKFFVCICHIFFTQASLGGHLSWFYNLILWMMLQKWKMLALH